MRAPSDVVVVGGGITGLAAARDLVLAGATVTLVEPDEPGGKLHSSPFGGGSLDEAADAFLARVPDGVALCEELGLGGDLVTPCARRAYVWSRGALRLLPEAQVLGVPTDLDELAASGIVSAEGVERARHDLSAPLLTPEGDLTIGALVRSRLGDEVAERLVDPLVGGINAGDTDRLSLAATVPQLDAAARSGAGSLIEACRIQRAAVADPAAPVFFAPRGGMGSLATATLSDAVDRGLRLRRGRADSLRREGGRWSILLDDASELAADGVVVTAPAPTAASLVRPHAARAATLLASIEYASVAMIAVAVPRSGIERELDASGFLVPREEGRTITACSWATSKWPHLTTDDTVWLRASVGRDGDDRALRHGDAELVEVVLADLAETMAVRAAPLDVRVTRWPGSLPQYRPGHLERVAAIESDLDVHVPTLAVAGAALRGLGVPACIRQGRAAAGRVLAALDPTR